MCGIVASVSTRNIVPILVQGLQRLEYRGYDSCGVAVYADGLKRARSTSRVAELMEQVSADKLESGTGIAHTRWATHGAPAVHNAHPHFSHGSGDAAQKPGRVALVHNGIIENHDELRAELQARGYVFASQTDTEVIVHLMDSLYDGDLFEALQATTARLHGAYAIAAFCKDEPHRVVGARSGSPLILGVGKDGSETFLASDAMALAGVTDQILYLEEGDMVDIQLGKYWVINRDHKAVQREVKTVQAHSGAAELGPYRHYMQKEIFEQPRAIADTLEGVEGIVPELFGDDAYRVFKDIDSVLILACGTSYYSGCAAKYWLESIARIPTQVEVASEYRYRTSVPNPRTLVVTITQSGETADTLAALRHAQSLGMTQTLTICNVSTSAMVRECKLAYITRAGVEIGVASTKAFTTQLAGLFLLTLALAQSKGRLSEQEEEGHLKAMRHLPAALQAVLALEPQVISWAEDFAKMENALFLGRGLHYPIALEGALKLKEISYIHAEAYPAGELKHGPLALVTSAMPVVTVAPNDTLLEKLKSNMQEVRARGGVLYVLADADTKIESSDGIHVIRMPEHYGALSPLLHVVPLQLLAYHTAVARGTDVDKPRNLAKSVTVE
ncbi:MULTISPECIES: glutamine--fructose-6-phosphate transaminase (isomerizing) [unclassified Polaromonas]|jgi:glucosamine--fructose-6-phosphate aminotransferase (isomerizing)|uniref:glutamine--fructose-6-phosphate transaminase (isomerizing) n=1 Tax=unclassified Polaromonas TaxID=2638319 RepID=UPI000BCE7E5F|nr:MULTISPECIES: glutamine--fructose-6-phosphate transaminase (isomerizing) [unclassified Polaromonas]OYY36063.1 MAG: glutamine--fructose-6-phosphate transaminase (isomerizing) [Polaromonas sp. 35-63-35]OYZ20014.1 MAG: glutamine--fructose-6-phosphate transaminase (isomerizing) [Polaromonas sp. 16-63-31]OYZ79871.1 MAG: glutamine--fructose-6-phosphate transaminase (isomerizing) [Polaromonas sp. 24-63-21]OZA52218.1 MAG: glutamine--fructose-6-phosphate transaminase (isomerizing) [Polaromonas sp. 17